MVEPFSLFNPLLLGTSVASSAWEEIFLKMFRGELSPPQMKTLLLLLAKKGEGASEIWGCLRALRRLEPPSSSSLPFLIDLCGTGGDRAGTFNISTVASFVLAGAGAYVAKHGNRSVSSRVGSSDLLEALGVPLALPFRRMLQALRTFHFAYFHAPLYHPSFSKVQDLRRALKIRTLFNLLGPLLNPLQLRYQMIGVGEKDWLGPVAEALRRLGRLRAAVFRSEDGLDELSTRAPSDILYIDRGKIQRFRLDPRKFGFSKVKKGDFEGGDLRTNQKIARGILEDRIRGSREEIVLLNSGFALWLTGKVPSIEAGVAKSRWSIRTGRARGVLDALRSLGRRGRK